MNKIIKLCVLTALSNQWQIEPIKDESLQPGRGGLVTSHTAEDDGREIGLHSALNWCFNGFFIVSSWICFRSFLGRREILGFSKCKIHLQKKKKEVQAAREPGATSWESEWSRSEWSRSSLCELIGCHFLLAALSGSGTHTFIWLHYTLDIRTWGDRSTGTPVPISSWPSDTGRRRKCDSN